MNVKGYAWRKDWRGHCIVDDKISSKKYAEFIMELDESVVLSVVSRTVLDHISKSDDPARMYVSFIKSD